LQPLLPLQEDFPLEVFLPVHLLFSVFLVVSVLVLVLVLALSSAARANPESIPVRAAAAMKAVPALDCLIIEHTPLVVVK
jgi:hypothetical protein